MSPRAEWLSDWFIGLINVSVWAAWNDCLLSTPEVGEFLRILLPHKCRPHRMHPTGAPSRREPVTPDTRTNHANHCAIEDRRPKSYIWKFCWLTYFSVKKGFFHRPNTIIPVWRREHLEPLPRQRRPPASLRIEPKVLGSNGSTLPARKCQPCEWRGGSAGTWLAQRWPQSGVIQ